MKYVYVLFVSQRGLQLGGGGGKAGRPDRVLETAQQPTEQEAAQPHRSALTTVRPPPPCEEATSHSTWEPEPDHFYPDLSTQRRGDLWA